MATPEGYTLNVSARPAHSMHDQLVVTLEAAHKALNDMERRLRDEFVEECRTEHLVPPLHADRKTA